MEGHDRGWPVVAGHVHLFPNPTSRGPTVPHRTYVRRERPARSPQVSSARSTRLRPNPTRFPPPLSAACLDLAGNRRAKAEVGNTDSSASTPTDSSSTEGASDSAAPCAAAALRGRHGRLAARQDLPELWPCSGLVVGPAVGRLVGVPSRRAVADGSRRRRLRASAAGRATDGVPDGPG
jgi:hypothetical protein